MMYRRPARWLGGCAEVRVSATGAGLAFAEEVGLELHYRRGWLERFYAWVERLSLPPWLFYLLLYLVEVALLQVGQWLAGVKPPGALQPAYLWITLLNVYGLAAAHYCYHQAGLALDSFRPALDLSDADFARLRYRLVTVPPGPAWLATGLAILLGASALWLTPGWVAGDCAQCLAQSVAQKVIRIFDPPSARQEAGIQCRPQLARPY